MARTTPSTSSGRGSTRVGSSRGGGAGSAARRKQVKPVKPRPWGLILASLLVAAFAVGAITYAALQEPADPTAIDGVQTIGDLESGQHVATAVTYDQVPPAGGAHDPAWQNCGVYTSPVRNENAVHSLEHGAVWITYRPDLPADQVEKLRDLVNQRPGFRMLSPYPGLESPVAASAWGKLLRVDSADDDRLGEFADAFTQGPQTPEPGATCAGGVGAPV